MFKEIYKRINGNSLKKQKKDENCFPESVYNGLPPFMKEACKLFDEDFEKDIFLLGAITLISGCLPNVFGLYDKRRVESNLYSFIVAPASAGKGSLIWTRKLVLKVHNYLKNQRTEEKNKLLLIPANNSASGFSQALADNEGRGVLFCTEADTLSQAIEQDWGNYSDVMRSGFHHEPISLMRRGNKEYFELENPFISILLSGTPGQTKKLIPSSENGLFSRFCFYSFSIQPTMKDVFSESETDLAEHFEDFSDQILNLYKRLKLYEHSLEFVFSEEQKPVFIRKFDTWHKQYFNLLGFDVIPSVRRLGLILFRIAMILSMLRIMQNEKWPKQIICQQVDFETALMIVEKLLSHTVQVFSKYQKDNLDSKLSGKKLQLYNRLPDMFPRKHAIKIAQEIKMSVPTLDRFLTNREFFKKPVYGNYQKVS